MPVSTSSICEGNTLVPRMMSMSSVRPRMRPILRWVRPQAQGSALMEVTSEPKPSARSEGKAKRVIDLRGETH